MITPSILNSSKNPALYSGPHDLCYRIYSEYMVSRGFFSHTQSYFVETIHNKRLFRTRLGEISRAHNPKFISKSDGVSPETALFPLLFKPDHAGGGRGIVLLNNLQDYKKFIETECGKEQLGIYEELIPGQLHSISLWLCNRQIQSFYGEREFVDFNKFRVNGSISSNKLQQKFQECGIPQKLAEILGGFGLSDGFVHTQLMIDGNGDWKIVECMLRLPGDLYSYNAENFGSFPYSDMYLAGFEKKSALIDFPEKAIFPDEHIYGRVIHRPGEILDEKIMPNCSFYSHHKNHPDAYSISFFKATENQFLWDEGGLIKFGNLKTS
jgi:hypothetical protein